MINTGKLAGLTLFITGASRGIGKAIALKAARDGANIVVAARSTEPNNKMPGTIYEVAEEIEKVGGRALPCPMDICDANEVRTAIHEAHTKFGGIDIVVNNAAVTAASSTAGTKIDHLDIMYLTNTRGPFLVIQECLPYLVQSEHAHILNIAPPINLDPIWLAPHVGYTISKYSMSMYVLGMSYEFAGIPIAVNALWPRTVIGTETTKLLMGPESFKRTRKADIMADAAYSILIREPTECTGRFLIDDEVLAETGVTDFKQYATELEFADEIFQGFFLDIPKEKLNPIPRDIPAWKAMQKEGNVTEEQVGLVQPLFKKIEPLLTTEIVRKTQAIYQFNIEGFEKETWFIDLKNGDGQCGKGTPPKNIEPDATLTMKPEHFFELFTGKIKPTTALIMGKLKISGDINKALKLEKLIRSLKSKV